MKTLIAYATKYGSTEKCAKFLAENLTGEVELCNLAIFPLPDLSAFNQVIIGGSIYAGRIQKHVSQFCSTNFKELERKRLGLFICGMLNDQAEAELTSAFTPELLANAVAKDFFGGEFQFQKINFVERFMVKMVSKMAKDRPTLDTSQDFSTISEPKIISFAQTMNKTAP